MRFVLAAVIALAAALVLLASANIDRTASAQTGCVETLTTATVEGTWSTACTSSIAAPSGSGDRYARFYTFSLDNESDVTIDISSDEDTYLYLRSGSATEGSSLHENDDYNYPTTTDSRIVASLDAGTYTIEATTYAAGKTGSFTLTVSGASLPSTTTPSPSPDPSPSPTPPDTTTPIPEGCTSQTFSGTSEDDSWSSDCVSQNRTENGDHYAKFFSFSVSRSAAYHITLVSQN